jgi:hypothetical protein
MARRDHARARLTLSPQTGVKQRRCPMDAPCVLMPKAGNWEQSAVSSDKIFNITDTRSCHPASCQTLL